MGGSLLRRNFNERNRVKKSGDRHHTTGIVEGTQGMVAHSPTSTLLGLLYFSHPENPYLVGTPSEGWRNERCKVITANVRQLVGDLKARNFL